MKIPKYIKEAIMKASHHFKIAHENNDIVRDWFDKNGLIDSNTGDGENGFNLDSYIDLVEYGVGGGKVIIEELESKERGNLK